MRRRITLPNAGVVLLVGPSGSGKTTLLQNLVDRGQIKDSEILSSDKYRKIVADQEYNSVESTDNKMAQILFEQYQRISKEAFELLELTLEARCRLNKCSFIDATNINSDDRKKMISIAHRHHLPISAIVLDIDLDTLLMRDNERVFPRGSKRIKQQMKRFQYHKRYLKTEGYHQLHMIKELNHSVEIERMDEVPPIDVGAGIDIIGDIHGCYTELLQLLEKLGYEENEQGLYTHPLGRKLLSLGDIMSRGPRSLETLLFFKNHVNNNLAYMIDSNHGWKIYRWLKGNQVTLQHGDELTAKEINQWLATYSEEEQKRLKDEFIQFLGDAPAHYIIEDKGVPMLVCTHAGIKDEYIGKKSQQISDYCRYGESSSRMKDGIPIRGEWYHHHTGHMTIIWGHDPRPYPTTINSTINIDQGVVFGGKLTAYRYPEKSFVAVDALKNYNGIEHNPIIEWKSKRLLPPNIQALIEGFRIQMEEFEDVSVKGKYVKPVIGSLSTADTHFGQLVYLPPTMSPVPIPSQLPDYLEHPIEAFKYYRDNGVNQLIVEKKHMGSRGILLIFKNEEVALNYTGISNLGAIYSRSGKRFFKKDIEERILTVIQSSLKENDYFDKYETDFVLLDCEIMPWNLKAQDLINKQYELVAESAILDRKILVQALNESMVENQWLKENEEKLERAESFQKVYEKYCWEVSDIDRIVIAPFHILAHSGRVYHENPHTWHMTHVEELSNICSIFRRTEYLLIEGESDWKQVINWWKEITEEGHEGMVVKPNQFTVWEKGKLLQPALKVRGRKYLQIIYGIDYLEEKYLERLKKRNTKRKQKLALQEFSLGIEALNRFVKQEEIGRIHECIVAILALEGDEVDPRL